MSDTLESTHLKLPFLAPAQAQKHVTHNEALRHLDAIVQLAVLEADQTAPPGEPEEGDRYIVAASATGAWAGHDGEVAALIDGAWEFFVPEPGWLAYGLSAGMMLVRTTEGWEPFAGGGIGDPDMLGINAAADAVNRLAVRSEAVLFSGIETTDGGSGDIRFTVNKEADADSATLLFQSGWSGRAEIGLAGDTDFVFKVSPDGTNWAEAIRIDKDTGRAAIGYDNSVSGLSAITLHDAIDEIAAGGGGGESPVVSVFGRTGAVTAAAGDYEATEIGFTASGSLSATDVQSAIEELDAGKAAAGHDHDGDYQPLDGGLSEIAGLSPAKGNLIVGNGSAWVAVGAGANGEVLTAASGAAAGVEWAEPPAGGGSGGSVDSVNGVGPIGGNVDLTASDIPFTPSGGLGAADIQAALAELDSEKAGASHDHDGDYQPLDADLGAIAAVTAMGLLARTGAGSAAARTLIGGTGIAVTNGNGVSGNPTFSADLGKTAIVFEAREWAPTLTNGCGTSYEELTGNDVISETLDFDTSVQEFATFAWRPPERWDRGSISYQVQLRAPSGSGTQTAVFGLSAGAAGNDDAADAAFGTVATVTDSFIAAGDLHTTPESSALTVAGSPAAGDRIVLKLQRNVASDTMAGDLKVERVIVFYTETALKDG